MDRWFRLALFGFPGVFTALSAVCTIYNIALCVAFGVGSIASCIIERCRVEDRVPSGVPLYLAMGTFGIWLRPVLHLVQALSIGGAVLGVLLAGFALGSLSYTLRESERPDQLLLLDHGDDNRARGYWARAFRRPTPEPLLPH